MNRLDAIALPEGLIWRDEYAVSSVSQPMRRRLDGGLVVYPRALTSGRAITLEITVDDWMTRVDAAALTALAAVPGATYLLTLRGQFFTVLFRHHDAPALELTPMIDYADPAPDDPVVGQIKLMEA